MKNRIQRVICVLTAVLIATAACGALADGWTCTNCGQSGNTGNFCPNCGSAAPAPESWTCASCGQSGNTGNFCTNCAAPRPSSSGQTSNAPQTNTSQTTYVNERLEQIPGETDRVKVCLQSVDASSYITNKQNPNKWNPANASDGDESTCWQFSAKKGLKGKSWLDLNVGTGMAVDEIWFKNGFWAYNDKGGDQYVINARPKGIRIEFLYGGETKFRNAMEVTLKDESRNGWQMFSVGHQENVSAVRLGILTTYKGTSFPNDVCLSEVILVQYAPYYTAREPQPVKAATVYESRPDVTGCSLLMKLSTRSGPGTQYDEPGTFFGNNWQSTIVRVLGKSWDGSIWWVLVDFSNGGKASYRVWTGLKRVDVELDKLKEIYPIGQGTVSATSDTYRGPGGKYARANISINQWKDVVAYGRENGYVEVEFEQGSRMYRLWVPENVTSIDWGNDFSGNN